jgi:hypothetical protein
MREIEAQEIEYKQFREALTNRRKNLGELDYLDEMINDFNYLLFHQHVFGEMNEFELAKLDKRFNSPGMDLMFQDYCGIVGIGNFHSMVLNCICQFIVIFPVALIFEHIAWGDPETWVTFKP